MKSMDQLNMLVLSSAENLGFPERSADVILVSVFLKMSGMILSILSGRLCLSLVTLGSGKKNDSMFRCQNHK